MTTKQLARKALQSLHDAYNAIPDVEEEDFDHINYKGFEDALDKALEAYKKNGNIEIEAQMVVDAKRWAEKLPDNTTR